jgi:hypothetical protein
MKVKIVNMEETQPRNPLKIRYSFGPIAPINSGQRK